VTSHCKVVRRAVYQVLASSIASWWTWRESNPRPKRRRRCVSFHERFSPSVSSGPNPIAGETCYVHLQRIASGWTSKHKANPLDFEVREQLGPDRTAGRNSVPAARPLNLDLAMKAVLPVGAQLQIHRMASGVLAQ